MTDATDRPRGPAVSCWVACFLPPAAAGAVAVPDGSPADSLHVTLAHLGRAPVTAWAGVPPLVAALAPALSPLRGRLTGIGRFPRRAGRTPVFATLDVPGLEELRREVVRVLVAGAGYEDDGRWHPHVTLLRARPGDRTEVRLPRPVPLELDVLTTVVAGVRHDVPLGPGAPP